jgi:DNA invertase Pin-like site-specific DNA recombinase
MAKKTKSSKGLPKALQADLDDENAQHEREVGLQEFVAEMHGEGAATQPQDGLPSLDWLKETFKTKSAVIRYLVNQGHSVNDIAKHLGLRYQHVRNVATAPLKRGPNEDWRKPLLEASGLPDLKQFKPEED